MYAPLQKQTPSCLLPLLFYLSFGENTLWKRHANQRKRNPPLHTQVCRGMRHSSHEVRQSLHGAPHFEEVLTNCSTLAAESNEESKERIMVHVGGMSSHTRASQLVTNARGEKTCATSILVHLPELQ